MPAAATDAMIARLETELEERNAFIEGLVGRCPERQPGPQQPGDGAHRRRSVPDRATSSNQLDAAARDLADRHRVPQPDARDRPGAGPPARSSRRRPASSTGRPAPTSPTCTTASSATVRRPSAWRSSTVPPPTRPRPTTPACCPRPSCSRSSTSSRWPGRSSTRSARPTSAPAPGPTPGSPSTRRSAGRPERRPSWRRAR